MPHYNLGILGYGNVGRALVALLNKKAAELREQYGLSWRVAGIASRRIGWRASPHGLNTDDPMANPASASNVQDWLAAGQIDVMFELSSLNPQTGQPAIDYLRAALEHGAHIVTANKGPIVHAYRELRDLAASKGKRFLFESTVMGGTPIFSLFRGALPGTRLVGFRGLVNSTTSVILEQIENGGSLEDGIRRAQALGITETDPSADVDGWDAAVKVCALVNVLMDVPFTLQAIDIAGIRGIDPDAVRAARGAGKKYRLLSSAALNDGQVVARVRPEILEPGDPLAGAATSAMAITLQTDVFHKGLTVIENDGTIETTAYGVLADFLTIVQGEAG